MIDRLPSAISPALLAAASTFLLLLAAGLTMGAGIRIRSRKRIRTAIRETAEPVSTPPGTRTGVRRGEDAVRLLLGTGHRLALLIDQAGARTTPGALIARSALMAGVAGAGAVLASGTGWAGLPAAVLGSTVPVGVLLVRRERRRTAFEHAFPEAIDLMARAARAGHSLTSTFGVVADEAPEPIASAFGQLRDEQRYGLPTGESLLGLAERWDLPDVRLFVTAVQIHRETGGNLAENLDRLSAMIRDRFRFRREVATRSAHGRVTGAILVLTPLALLLVFQILNPDYVRPLFETPPGRWMLGSVLALQGAGALVIRRMTALEL